MNDRVRLVMYKKKFILAADFSHLCGSEYVNAVKELKDFIVRLDKPPVLLFIDARETAPDGELVVAAKESAQHVKHLIKKASIVGATGYRKGFLDIITLFSDLEIQPFETENEAMEWLVQ